MPPCRPTPPGLRCPWRSTAALRQRPAPALGPTSCSESRSLQLPPAQTPRPACAQQGAVSFVNIDRNVSDTFSGPLGEGRLLRQPAPTCSWWFVETRARHQRRLRPCMSTWQLAVNDLLSLWECLWCKLNGCSRAAFRSGYLYLKPALEFQSFDSKRPEAPGLFHANLTPSFALSARPLDNRAKRVSHAAAFPRLPGGS